jgi:hypothetical protein
LLGKEILEMHGIDSTQPIRVGVAAGDGVSGGAAVGGIVTGDI